MIGNNSFFLGYCFLCTAYISSVYGAETCESMKERQKEADGVKSYMDVLGGPSKEISKKVSGIHTAVQGVCGTPDGMSTRDFDADIQDIIKLAYNATTKVMGELETDATWSKSIFDCLCRGSSDPLHERVLNSIESNKKPMEVADFLGGSRTHELDLLYAAIKEYKDAMLNTLNDPACIAGKASCASLPEIDDELSQIRAEATQFKTHTPCFEEYLCSGVKDSLNAKYTELMKSIQEYGAPPTAEDVQGPSEIPPGIPPELIADLPMELIRTSIQEYKQATEKALKEVQENCVTTQN